VIRYKKSKQTTRKDPVGVRENLAVEQGKRDLGGGKSPLGGKKRGKKKLLTTRRFKVHKETTEKKKWGPSGKAGRGTFFQG